MTAPQWFSGPPPAVGWWPANTGNATGLYRWWDGSEWSIGVSRYAYQIDAQRVANIPSKLQRHIKWRHWSIKSDGTDGKGAHE